MKRNVKVVFVVLALVLSFTFFGSSCNSCSSCSPNEGGNHAVGDKRPFEYTESTIPSLIIGTNELNLMVGDTFVVNYVLKNSTEKVVFTSKDEGIAQIDENGKITAKDVGQTMVSVVAGSLMRNIVVLVEASPTYSLVNFDQEVELIIGKNYALSPALYKGNERVEASFSYQSLNPTVASVNGNGVVTANASGKCEIIASCTKDGKTYAQNIVVYCHEFCYIEAENVTVNYGERTTLPYTVKDINGASIAGAVAEILAPSGITVNGNDITANDFGEMQVTLNYYGVKKTIVVNSIYYLAKEEFNYFGHGITIQNDRVVYRHAFNDETRKVGIQRIDSHAGVTPENGKILKISSQSAARASERDLGFYLSCRQTKEQLQALKAEGYNYIKLNFMVEADDALVQSYFEFSWTNGLSMNVRAVDGKFGVWIQRLLPLQDYIDNYDVINPVANATAAKTNFFMACYSGNDGDSAKVPYTVYIQPLQIVK